jgi:RNase P subunit RPR2
VRRRKNWVASFFRCRTCATILGDVGKVGLLSRVKSAPGVQAQYLANGAVDFICPQCGKHNRFEWSRPVLDS